MSPSNSANRVCSNVSFTRSLQMTVTTPNLQQGVVPNFIVNQSPVLDMKPPVFDGNPINYCSFIDAFDAIIDCAVVESKRRLFFLLQYTAGAAHTLITLIKGCYMPADQGYQTARKLLRDNFGQKIQFATTCIDFVVEGPALNKQDKNDLLEFSIKLTSCVYTLSGMDYLQKIDNLYTITKLVRRFPNQWISSWEHTVDQLLHVKQKDVTSKKTLLLSLLLLLLMCVNSLPKRLEKV